MKSAYQMMQAIALTQLIGKEVEKPITISRGLSKPNGTMLAAKKHKRRIANKSRRYNRKR